MLGVLDGVPDCVPVLELVTKGVGVPVVVTDAVPLIVPVLVHVCDEVPVFVGAEVPVLLDVAVGVKPAVTEVVPV